MKNKKRTRLDIIIALFRFKKIFPKASYGSKQWKLWLRERKLPPINKKLYQNLCYQVLNNLADN